MKKLKNILTLLIIFIVFIAIFGTTLVYGAETRNLNYQDARPYSDDNNDGTIGNDVYLLKRTGPKLYNIVKIYDTANTQANGQPTTFKDFIYCLRGGKGFGAETTNEGIMQLVRQNLQYQKIADMKTDSESAIREYKNLYNVDLNRTENINGKQVNIYNAILWIVDNAYLPVSNNSKNYNAEEYKKELLEKVGVAEVNKLLITDDDLEVIQQLAFWYFANYDQNSDSSSVSIQNYNTSSYLSINKNNDIFGTQRAEYLNKIFNYFIENAINNASKYGNEKDRTIKIEEPKITQDTTVKAIVSTVGNFYAIGPFKMNKTEGNVNYTVNITFKDANGKVIPKSSGAMPIYYITEKEDSMKALDGTIEDIIETGKQFYIKINSIYFTAGEYDLSKVTLELTYSYNYFNGTATMWESSVNPSNNQVVVIIEREKFDNGNTITITTEEAKEADLSLRKFITKINDDASYGQASSNNTRVPKLDTSKLNTIDSRTNLKITTAKYIHPKNTVQVKTGDKVIYTIRIYNEGEIDGTATKVIDYLPEGLKLVPSSQSSVNTNYGWTNPSNDGKTIETGYLKNLIIKAYNSTKLAADGNENWQKATNGPSGLSYVDLQIECEVVGDSTTTPLNLKNIAEIVEDNVEDRDSVPKNIGNEYTPGKEDDGYFPGEEDDDDREELIIPGKEFDVSLRKFITKINDTELTGASSRIPTINIVDLKSSKETTASYIHLKNKLTLKREDLITYTIRVYNEGSLDGKVTQITDYIPDGLEFVTDNEINKRYGWTINSNGSISTAYLKDSLLKCYDPTTISGDEKTWQQAKDDQTGLYYFDVKVVCKIKNSVENGTTLTNIAEITGAVDKDNKTIKDRDSIPANFPEEKKVNSYEGNGEKNGYYPGLEDDDDFERVTVKSELEEKKEFDLALRKYITKVETVDGTTKSIINTAGESNVRDLTNIDVSPLNTGSTTASYEHRKDPVVVETGDVVTYTLRVYNEGETNGEVKEIIDILPEGVELYTTDLEKVETSDSNIEIWTKKKTSDPGIEDGLFYKYIYTFNKTTRELKIECVSEPVKYTTMFSLAPFDSTHANQETTTNKTGWINGLNYGEISFRCKVTATTTETNKVLTNVARITKDLAKEVDQPDRDSNPEIFTVPSNLSSYKGDNTNKSDLSDNEYFYKGQEDDDDFEKLIILGKQFDLSLRKYITSINGEKTEVDRTPQIDMTTLENKTSTTAKYEHSKDPIVVKQGDIITYTIRVYNEGDRDGKATEITDYIPEGLGMLIGYSTNVDNLWKITDLAEAVKLSSLENVYNVAKNNLKASDFTGIQSLDDVQIAKGNTSVTSAKLENDNYVIKAYDNTKTTMENSEKWQKAIDGKGTTGLYYQDIQVACIVLAPNTCTDVLRNIAEISKAEDANGNKILISGDDRDSVPNNVNTETYNPPEDNSKYQEDDDDYEPVILKYFDLALRKFITNVNDKTITSRIPELSIDSTTGNIKYTHPKEELPVKVANNDVVTYTLRIFNEGTLDGYAAEITDDIPEGLEFIPDNTTNKTYKWVMYREIKKDEEVEKSDIKTIDGVDYIKTEEAEEAKMIVTEYLSKENEKTAGENLLQIFDPSKALSNTNPSYLDVKVAFKVIEPNTSNRTIINSAQISGDTDKYGRDIDDFDSTPNEWNDGEDDQDKEYIYVEYFDLSLLKWVTKTVVTVDNETTTTETGFKPNQGKTDQIGENIRYNTINEPIAKVEINRKKLKTTTVKFVYSIMVSNEGEIPGFATEITDYIPSGLEFKEEDNKSYGWIQEGDSKVITRALEGTLLNPGDSKTIEIVFTWKNNEDNLGLKTNIAEITEDYNDSNSKDIDSTIDNKLKPYEKEQEDDDDYALVMLSIKTGSTKTYFTLIGLVFSIIGCGVLLIKRYVLV